MVLGLRSLVFGFGLHNRLGSPLVVAPEEQNVYSPESLRYTAPVGAECKWNSPKHMALRWSAQLLEASGYKHRAPPEHFRGLNHFSRKAGPARLARVFLK